MSIDLVAPKILEAALAKEFPGVDADRKKILVQHVQNAIARHTAADLHKIFSENLQGGELAFYNEIVTETPDDDAAGPVAVPQPNQPALSPEAAADAHSETARAAEAESARSRSR